MKKDFTGMDSIFHKTTDEEKIDKFSKEVKSEIITSDEQILKEELEKQYITRTYLIEKIYYQKIKSIAYFNDITQKDIVNNALKEYLKVYELENGFIKVK
jgi:hypothetical protein